MLYVREESVNQTRNNRIGDSKIYESRFETIGALYRSCRKDFGRCTGAIRIEPTEKRIGWVFVQRRKYEDSRETYLHETWVTVYDLAPPDAKVKFRYRDLDS